MKFKFKFNVQYHISRYPIYLVVLFLVANLIVRLFYSEFDLTGDEFEVYKKVMKIDKPFFLINDIILLAVIGNMVLHIISVNKSKTTAFCSYHKLGVGILASFPILNIVSTLTPFDFTVYNSIIGKIALFVALVWLGYLYINRDKRKETTEY